ncbi:MAG: hypothetical protein DRO40_08910 [Thermoprotei archaeon]|nr:MAG: hypothetical protein DRO40_08910 [Thermoprotei archaeon]
MNKEEDWIEAAIEDILSQVKDRELYAIALELLLYVCSGHMEKNKALLGAFLVYKYLEKLPKERKEELKKLLRP